MRHTPIALLLSLIAAACGNDRRPQNNDDTRSTDVANDTSSAPDDGLGEVDASDATPDTSQDAAPSLAPNVSEVLAETCPVKENNLRWSPPAGSDLQKLTLDAPLARCNDGSPAIAYVRAASSEAHTNRWVFHLQGGGGCASHDECEARWCGEQGLYDAAKMSSRWAKPTMGAPGLFKRETGNAPGQWNQVFVYYCSSDMWLGQDAINLTGADGKVYSLHARGHQILEALLDRLDTGASSDSGDVKLPKLADAEVILWTGASAGAVGASQHLDHVAERYPDAQVAGVFDNAFGPDNDAFSEEVQDGANARFEQTQRDFYLPARAFYDASCVASYPSDEPWRCSGSGMRLDHITTPFFQRQDLRDPTASQGLISLGATIEVWASAVREALLRLADIPTTAAEKDDIVRAPGIYATNCKQHIGTMSDDWYDGATVKDESGAPLTYKQALQKWLTGDDVVIIDTDPATKSNCRATNQDR